MKVLELKPLLSLMMCSLALVACQPNSGSAPVITPEVEVVKKAPSQNVEPKQEEELEVEAPVFSQEFLLQLVKESSLNIYSVRLQTNLPVSKYEVYRSTDQNSQGELVKSLTAGRDAFVEEADGRNFVDRYVYYNIVVDNEVVHTQKFHIKPDLVVEGDFYVFNNLPNRVYRFSTLSLKGSARLFLEKADVVFHADVFQSENAKIIGFNSHRDFENTKNGLDGANAGTLSIYAGIVRGHLNIDLRGANGLKGEKGQDSTQQGPKGKTGAAEQTYEYRDCTPGVYRNVGPEIAMGLQCSKYLACSTPATSGGRGEPGAPGEVGKRGGHAGNGGRFNLYADNADIFTAEYDTSAGTPGDGGDGGLGGPGGAGGDPGPRGRYCSWSAGVGPQGLQGPQGATGSRGDVGAEGQVNIEVKSRQLKVNEVKGRI